VGDDAITSLRYDQLVMLDMATRRSLAVRLSPDCPSVRPSVVVIILDVLFVDTVFSPGRSGRDTVVSL